MSWNAEVRGEAVITPREPVLHPVNRTDDALWEQLIRDTSQELVNILRKRKQIFFPDEIRLIRRCFCNELSCPLLGIGWAVYFRRYKPIDRIER